MKSVITLYMCITMFAATSLFADKLVLNRGGELMGTLVGKSGKNVRFKTLDGDTVSFRWKTISELRSDHAVILCRDGTIIEGPVVISRNVDAIEKTDLKSVEIVEFAAVKRINPEPWRLNRGWHTSGMVNIALRSERGNVDRDDISIDARLVVRDLYNRFTFGADVQNSQENGNEIQSKWYTDGRYSRFLHKQLYASAAYSFRQDKYANLDLRSAAGLGGGYQLLDGDNTSFSAEALLSHIWERVDGEPNSDYLGASVIVEFNKDLIPGYLTFFVDASGTLNLEESGYFFLDGLTGFRAPVWRGVILTAEVKSEYNSEPVGDAETTDNTYRFKVGYKW